MMNSAETLLIANMLSFNSMSGHSMRWLIGGNSSANKGVTLQSGGA